MKKIMILGAGIYQLPLIKQAKKMGIYTIVVSYPGNYPGFKYADEIEYIDIRDQKKVLKAAEKHKIDGICTSGSDVGIKSIGLVNDTLGLSGISYSSALMANNKYEMKKAFRYNNVNTPYGFKVNNVTEAKKAFYELGGNIIFKTVDSSGNRGIIHIKDPLMIEEAFQESLFYSNCPYILVEEFLSGKEIGAEAFIQNGEINFVLPHNKIIIETNSPVPIGQSVPFEADQMIKNNIDLQVRSGIYALGIDNCPVNVDIMIYNNNAYIIEIGARAGGGPCLPESVSLYYGFNHYENIIKVALGEFVDFKFKSPTPNASRLLISPKNGVIKKIEFDNLNDPNLIDFSLDYREGDKVCKFLNKTNRLGHILVKGVNAKEAEDKIEKILEKIKIIIE
jgi:carbamoylphosphate synthase large subunit